MKLFPSQKASEMRLNAFLKLELFGIKKYSRDVNQEIYSREYRGILHSIEAYESILSKHSDSIHKNKARLEEIMDLTDIKEG